MDLLEFVAEKTKEGRSTHEIRELLVKNGYPVYDIDNALALAEKAKDGKEGARFGKMPNVPGYVVIFAMAGVLILVGVITLVMYFLK